MYLARTGGSTMDVPVRLSPPSIVPSEAVAEIRCSHVVRKRAARALSFFSFIEPYPPRDIADAAMRPSPARSPGNQENPSPYA